MAGKAKGKAPANAPLPTSGDERDDIEEYEDADGDELPSDDDLLEAPPGLPKLRSAKYLAAVKAKLVKMTDDPFHFDGWLSTIDDARRYLPNQREFYPLLDSMVEGSRVRGIYYRCMTKSEPLDAFIAQARTELSPEDSMKDLVSSISSRHRYDAYARTEIPSAMRADYHRVPDRAAEIVEAAMNALPPHVHPYFAGMDENDVEKHASMLHDTIRQAKKRPEYSSAPWADKSRKAETSSAARAQRGRRARGPWR